MIDRTEARWSGAELRVRVREDTSPFASPLEGELIVRPTSVTTEAHALDADGKHQWAPIAPHGRIEAHFDEPRLTFRGRAYLDHNAGDELLGRGFDGWTWSRMSSDDRTAIVYDVTRRGGLSHRIARTFHADGRVEDSAGRSTITRLPRTRFQIERAARAVGDASIALGRTLEDTPFYARSHLVGQMDGRPASGVHEVVDLGRFESRLVQAMLPYRMKRIGP